MKMKDIPLMVYLLQDEFAIIARFENKNEAGELIYADKLINIIKNYNLMLYDTKVERED